MTNREVKVREWDIKQPTGEKRKENTVDLVEALVRNVDPRTAPKGIDTFRILYKLAISLDEAKKTKVLKFEDSVYSYVKKVIDSNIPSVLGMNKDIYEAVDDILNAKKPEEKEAK